jgi:FKBP-type peptidyl-prolyl cis-trans isomerase SlyD
MKRNFKPHVGHTQTARAAWRMPSTGVKLFFSLRDFSMLISRNKVVRFDYTLTDDSAQVLDSSTGGEPLTYLHGSGNIIPGLESALEGKRAGESLSVRITAVDAYGERDDRLIQNVPREMFEDSDAIQVGMQFQSGDEDGNTRIVTVVSTDAANITVDGNHPLAGVPLNFAVTIVEVRDASSEELAHGHVHGPGGHEHE